MLDRTELDPALKSKVKNHWEAETCGTRYGEGKEGAAYFAEIARERYEQEPYIRELAQFESAKGKNLLEIGVGAGTDFENWCQYADTATGVDLTERAIELTQNRLRLKGIPGARYRLTRMDTEKLQFPSDSFDIVYSYGVLHHSPNTKQALAEALRVLRPGGVFRGMVYQLYSWTSLMLYLQHGLLKGRPFRSFRDVLFDHLESPGTKAYTQGEARTLVTEVGFTEVKIWTKLAPGDLLLIKPSAKYQGKAFQLIWRFYPRWLVRMLGDRFGLCLMIVAKKPT